MMICGMRLTEEGRSIAPQLFKIVAEVNGDFLAGLEQDEVSQLKGLLKKLMVTNVR